jgi:NAD(P)-dependent dehydrogenase (short-subunit alcohol dehydrogenase family)
MIENLFSLKKKISLVTGADGYLGKTICSTLAEKGSSIILVDNLGKEKNLLKKVEYFKRKYKRQNFYSFTCDFSKKGNIKNLTKKLKKFKQLDILINNAAFTGEKFSTGYIEKFERQTIEAWNTCLDVSITSVFDLVQNLLPKIKKSNSASIINISSIYGVYGPDWSIYKNTNLANPAAYAVAKAGLIQFTKWLSKTLGPKIRVNSISPGGIFRKQPKSFVNSYIKKTSLKRMAKEEDFIGVIVLLASNASSYITGQNIIVDGGWGT